MSVDVNILAVIIAAVLNMIIGWVWYGPAFGKTWLVLAGVDNQKMNDQAGGKDKAMKKSLGLGFIGALLMAYVLFEVLSYASGFLQDSGISFGLKIAFCLWLGFFAPVVAGKQLWEGKSWRLWCIEAGYYLVLLLINGAILASWI